MPNQTIFLFFIYFNNEYVDIDANKGVGYGLNEIREYSTLIGQIENKKAANKPVSLFTNFFPIK